MTEKTFPYDREDSAARQWVIIWYQELNYKPREANASLAFSAAMKHECTRNIASSNSVH